MENVTDRLHRACAIPCSLDDLARAYQHRLWTLERPGGGSFDLPVIGVEPSRVGPGRPAFRLCREISVDTIKPAEITFDPAKSDANARSRGLPFWLVWTTAQIGEDTRKDYGERRYIALGYVAQRLHVVVYAPDADAVRVISFRKANRREVRRYAKASQSRTDR